MSEVGNILDLISATKLWGLTVTVLLVALWWSMRRLFSKMSFERLEKLVSALELLRNVYLPRDADGHAVSVRLVDEIRQNIADHKEIKGSIYKSSQTGAEAHTNIKDIQRKIATLLTTLERIEHLLSKQGDELENHRNELRETLGHVHRFMIELSKSLVEALQNERVS